jgi:hypothetical protein
VYNMQEVRRQFGDAQDQLSIGAQDPSTVDVAAPASAVRLGPQLPLELHQAPNLGAIYADVRLNRGGHLADGGQIGAEQLRASLQRRRDRPSQVRVMPGPHRTRVSNTSSGANRERCVVRRAAHSLGGPCWGRNSAEPGGQQRTAADNKRRGQRAFRSDSPGKRNPWTALSHSRGQPCGRPPAAAVLSRRAREWGPALIRIGQSRLKW